MLVADGDVAAMIPLGAIKEKIHSAYAMEV